MLEVALIFTSILTVLALAGAAALFVSRQAILRDRDRLQTERDEHAQRAETLSQSLNDRDREIALANQKLDSLDEKQKDLQKLLDEAKTQFKDTFDALAGKALKGSTDEFLKLAKQVFESEQNKNREAVQNLVKPVRESLEQYQKKLTEAEQQRTQAFGSLKQQARTLAEQHESLRHETANLVKALRRPEVRGRWGEMQLERLFELAGMTERVDYDEQARIESSDGGSLRPDFTIHLPNERTIVIDVKTPVDAYLDATEATEDAERERHLEHHARQVRTAADNLASKAYWERCQGSPEFVVMFIPGESMLYAAAQRDPDLIDRAMARNVVIATPTVIMALLKTVAMGWQHKALSENAQEIADLGRELHERLAIVIEHITKLGSRIDSAVKQYNTLVGSVDARLLPSARRFVELRADSGKTIDPTVPPIETAVRDAPALTSETQPPTATE